jgi:hypothetical protein
LIGGGRSVRWTAARGSGIPLTRGGFSTLPHKRTTSRGRGTSARCMPPSLWQELCRLRIQLRGQLWRSNRRIHSRASCHPNSTGRDGVRAAPDQGPATSLPELSCRHPSSGAAFFNRGNQAHAPEPRRKRVARRCARRAPENEDAEQGFCGRHAWLNATQKSAHRPST